MEHSFWLERWNENQIGFHEGQANSMLASHFGELSVAPGGRIFVPLCGKSRDIEWLLSGGCRVVGAELSEIAIEQLFAELDIEPAISSVGNLKRYSAANIDIFVGDIFDLTSDSLGQVDAVYDRAALVALPQDMRRRYAQHMADITNRAPQLVICFEYDQAEMAGPPFSIRKEELIRLYEAHYTLTPIASAPVAGKLKGICEADETAWLLR